MLRFSVQKNIRPLPCSSFFAKRHARFACWLAGELTTALGRCQPFASIRLAAQEFSVWNKLRLFRFFYFIKKSVTRCTAPPFSQKGTLGSPAGLQAHSRRLSVAANLLRVFALRRKNFPFGTSYACSDSFILQKNQSPAALLLLFRKKARLVRLLACRRTHDGSRSLSTFCEYSPCGTRVFRLEQVSLAPIFTANGASFCYRFLALSAFGFHN